MTRESARWQANRYRERLAERRPSWYLDPLVAQQRRQLHLELIRNWAAEASPGRVLKTDVFEEAYGEDRLLPDLLPEARMRIGMDCAATTVCRAIAKCPTASVHFLVGDVRSLPLRSDSLDLIFSNSTLDHFESAPQFRTSVEELARVLRPGGRLIITLDNLSNPLYRPLRWASKVRWTPFRLGYTTSQTGLVNALEAAGLEVIARGTLIHNPRGISTLLFLTLRRLLGAHADGPIRTLLKVFASLEHLPTRRLTACFVSACARKPETPQKSAPFCANRVIPRDAE
jgi:SAM-dependent methyltransferase